MLFLSGVNGKIWESLFIEYKLFILLRKYTKIFNNYDMIFKNMIFNFFHLVRQSPLPVFTSILLSLTTIGLFSMYGYNFVSVLFLPLLFLLVLNLGF